MLGGGGGGRGSQQVRGVMESMEEWEEPEQEAQELPGNMPLWQFYDFPFLSQAGPVSDGWLPLDFWG